MKSHLYTSDTGCMRKGEQQLLLPQKYDHYISLKEDAGQRFKRIHANTADFRPRLHFFSSSCVKACPRGQKCHARAVQLHHGLTVRRRIMEKKCEEAIEEDGGSLNDGPLVTALVPSCHLMFRELWQVSRC
ncbi:hypothetical protein AV530_005524 [Patagioenas fasciata monilis]|uniref:Uncharacterized protein n=1 Tax=Patagioenas fasciata monilis TaxID=372326 RepID=A0A1V4JM45_PATFA|nr:hypothetical protein AV530_005524 [Patagioenas fasciata monilis]